MKTVVFVLCLAFSSLALQPASAQVARPGDKAVAKAIDRAIDSVDEFVHRLDSDLRKGTIRGASAEVDVSRYLDDFEEDFERLRKRFKSEYSASAEAVVVLRRANDVDRFMKSQSPSIKGRSEWDVASVDLNQLALAYGATFPATGETSARRVNDREVEQAVAAVIKQAQSYRKALKPSFASLESDALKSALANVDALAKAAKALKARIASGDPASGEAGVLFEARMAVAKDATGRTLSEAAATAWSDTTKAIVTIERAFGVS